MTVQVEVPPLLTGEVQLTVPLPPIPMLIVHVWMIGFALHVAVVPPLLPVQVQLQGPLPVIVEAVPVVQRLVVGVVMNIWLLEVPQAPVVVVELNLNTPWLNVPT